VPVTAYCAPAKDAFRKPERGMWRALCAESAEAGVTVDTAASFFVGDAAGRPDDHSDCDAAFARAIGVRFFLPEVAFAEGWAPLAEARAAAAARTAAAPPAAAAAAAAVEEVVVVEEEEAVVAAAVVAVAATTAGDSAADALVVL
jgi:histidinol phosphatase-like enzyme